MAHHHHHHDHHEHSVKQFNAAFICAIVLNLIFVVIEVIYARLTNSTSLLADAGHNLGDVLGLLMSWAALLLLAKKATDKYSYGFKRTTILAAFANAILLIATTMIIFYEAIQKILHPVIIQEMQVIVVAAIGIMVNGGTALLFAKGQHDLNIKAAFLHLAYDALISFGVVVSGFIIIWTHWYLLDALAGLVIGLFIFYGTWSLMRQSLNLIMDAVPSNIDIAAVTNFLKNYPGVYEVHHVHIWGLSTKEAALTAHIIFPSGITDAILREIHQQLAHKFHINHATLQVEQGGMPGNPHSCECP